MTESTYYKDYNYYEVNHCVRYKKYPKDKKLKRFTGFANYGKLGIEEIDVDAIDSTEALTLIKEVLKNEYEKGYSGIKVEERFGIYF